MLTIGERIKYFRKNILKITQQEFSASIMISRPNLGNIETGGINVTDRVIASICEKYNLNEDWLRNGTEPMYIKSDKFDVDAFIKSKGASEIEMQILKAYFELDPDVRNKVMETFKNTLNKSDS